MLKPDAGRKGKEAHGSLRAAAGRIPSGSSLPRGVEHSGRLAGFAPPTAHQPRLGGVADARPVFPCLVRATMPVKICPPSLSRAPVRCASHRRGGWIDVDRGHQRSAPFRTVSSTLAAGEGRLAATHMPSHRRNERVPLKRMNALWSRLTSHLKLAWGLISRWFNIRPGYVRWIGKRKDTDRHPSANPSASHVDLRTFSQESHHAGSPHLLLPITMATGTKRKTGPPSSSSYLIG
jgi:hypothetical protein